MIPSRRPPPGSTVLAAPIAVVGSLGLDLAPRLRAAAPGPPPSPSPLDVRAAAAVLGVSRATLDRRIADLPPDRLPLTWGGARRKRYRWLDADAVRAWWAAALAPVVEPPASRAPRRAAPPATGTAGITLADLRARRGR